MADLFNEPPKFGCSLLAIFIGFLLSASYIVKRRWLGKNLLLNDDFALLKERLDHYAVMQDQSTSRDEDEEIVAYLKYPPSRPVLSASSHKILLGVLKKIEAKNAVALTVTALLIGGLLSVSGSVVGKDAGLVYFYLLIVGVLFGPLVSGVDGARHLGQLEYRAFTERRLGKSCRATVKCRVKDMQRELMLDLIYKEYAFHAKTKIIGLAVLLVAFLIAALLSEFFAHNPLFTGTQ